ncbi:MAG: ribosomal L7Ae/L30e/S12e/Gadd45 family protein [Bacillota bacterium]
MSDSNNNKLVVGTRETLKAIDKDRAIKVYLAWDVETKIRVQLEKAVENAGIPLVNVDSKLKLGRDCGIDIAAASAALLKPGKEVELNANN